MMQTAHDIKSETGTTRSADWSRLENELKLWGRKLDELRQQSDRVGDSMVDDLQERYSRLISEAEKLKQGTDEELGKARAELESLSREAEKQSQSMLDAASANARDGADTAREMAQDVASRTKKTADHMAQSAQHLGTGFSRAWDELRQGFQRAADRSN